MATDSNPYEKEHIPRRGCGWLFLCLMLVIGSAWGAALGVFVWYVDNSEATIQALEVFRPAVGSKLLSAPTPDSDGEILGEFTSSEKRQVVRLSEIPLHLQKAFLAAEDHTFYEHKGVRPEAIISAVIAAPQVGKLRGASTITQQVVRNIESLGVGTDVTYSRKVHEAIVAFQVERAFTKDEILELYLNKIFLGISAYGVEAASRQYFGKSCRDVTLGEAATLAGLTRLPNTFEPIHNPSGALKYRKVVLDKMLEEGFIGQEEYDGALAEDVLASVEKRFERREANNLAMNNRFRAPYFAEEVRLALENGYGAETIQTEGYEIHTTIDMRLQEAAEKALLPALEAFDEKKKAYLEARGRGDEFAPVSGALVCIDNREPYRGFVRAMVGGRDFEAQQFNNATQAERQPGSSVKPFIWAAAIDNGYTPSSVVIDAPIRRVDVAGNVWSPKNFGNTYEGPMAIRHALEKSVNIVSIKLTEDLGVPTVRSYLERCGIPTDITGLSVALGAQSVTVLSHCAAYSTFANGGVRYEPILVTEVYDRDGLKQYDYRDHITRSKALDPAVAYVVTSMLEGVCTPDYKLSIYPSGWRSNGLTYPHGGKTGTTNDSRNVWFCGFSPQYTCVVWVGYPDNRSLGSGVDYTGGHLACPIWTEFMIEAHKGLPVVEFPVPYGVDFYNIDRLRGTKGGSYREAYLANTSPPTEWYGDLYKQLESIDFTLLGANEPGPEAGDFGQ